MLGKVAQRKKIPAIDSLQRRTKTIKTLSNHTKEHNNFTWFGKIAYVHGEEKPRLSFSPFSLRS